MPYYEGKRVSNAELRRLRGDKALTWREATGYGNAEEAPAAESEEQAPEPPKVRKRHGKRKAEAEAAMSAITGLDIELLGDDTEGKEPN